jgi:SAM-dependent methyltransferase
VAARQALAPHIYERGGRRHVEVLKVRLDSMPSSSLRALSARTRAVYERKGLQFDAERSRGLLERKWLERVAAHLPPGGSVLDAGCGGGEPIARYFLERGYTLTGVDFSRPLLALARERFPAAEWLLDDLRTLALPRRFDAVVGWHSFFHLTPGEQRATLPRLGDHLTPGGLLLLTVGPEAGEVAGRVGGDAVYHASLSQAAYRAVLDHASMDMVELVVDDPDCDYATVLLARKRQPPAGARSRGA